MKPALTILAFCFGMIAQTKAQNDSAQREEVTRCIQQLFDGMRQGDSSLVRQTFAPGMLLQTIVQQRDSTVRIATEDANGFLQAVGTPHPEIWDERISDVHIQLDGNLAHAWMNYSFYVDDRFSHCGVNSITLIRTTGGWRIQHIIDTRRKNNCD